MSPRNDNTGVNNNNVGPVLRAGEIARAAIDAVIEDNPEKEVQIDDKIAYIRVSVESECVIRRKTMERLLGRPFRMAELESVLGSFAGQIETSSEFVRFYFDKVL